MCIRVWPRSLFAFSMKRMTFENCGLPTACGGYGWFTSWKFSDAICMAGSRRVAWVAPIWAGRREICTSTKREREELSEMEFA